MIRCVSPYLHHVRNASELAAFGVIEDKSVCSGVRRYLPGDGERELVLVRLKKGEGNYFHFG